LPAFLAATAGTNPAERHARVTFASVTDLLLALGPPGQTVTLGGQNYDPRELLLNPPLILTDVRDRLEIAYQNTKFDQPAVLYLRLGSQVES